MSQYPISTVFTSSPTFASDDSDVLRLPDDVAVLLAGLGGRAVPPRGGGGGRDGDAVGDVAEDAVGPRYGDRDAAAREKERDHVERSRFLPCCVN